MSTYAVSSHEEDDISTELFPRLSPYLQDLSLKGTMRMRMRGGLQQGRRRRRQVRPLKM